MKTQLTTNFKTLAVVSLSVSISLLMGACTRSVSSPDVAPTSPAVLAPTEVVSLPIVPVAPLPVIEGLDLQEYALQGAPSADPFGFTPAVGTMDEILAKQEALRGESFPDNAFSNEQYPDMRRVMVGNKEVIARQEYNEDYSEGWVTVLENGVEVYRIATGPGSPITSLRNLWSYADHWVLETALINLNEANDPLVKFATGQLSQDGVLLNEQFGYSEIFGFQTLGGRPFYFFEKNGSYGFTYDGQVVEAGYANIPHFQCCSDAALNPKAAPNLVAFFAQKGETWYYVEIGVY